MADAQHSAGATAPACGQVDLFRGSIGKARRRRKPRDLAKRRELERALRRQPRYMERRRAIEAAVRERRKRDPARMAHRRAVKAALKRKYRRQWAAREGRELPQSPSNGRPLSPAARLLRLWDRQQRRLAVKNARQAWNWWLQIKAPDRWIEQHFSILGKPWTNPRLDAAAKHRLRYRLDQRFAERERERQSDRRFANPQMWVTDGARWWRATMSADGSVTYELLRALRQETHCAYCFTLLTPRNRHLDHVWPLSKGGAHSADNLVAACATCNRRKGALLPLQALLPNLWRVPVTPAGHAGDGGGVHCLATATL